MTFIKFLLIFLLKQFFGDNTKIAKVTDRLCGNQLCDEISKIKENNFFRVEIRRTIICQAYFSLRGDGRLLWLDGA